MVLNAPRIFVPLCLAALLLTGLSPAYGVPHVTGKRFPGQPRDHVHKIPDVRKLKAARMSPEAISNVIGATGTKKVAVVFINFPSAGTASGSSTISDTAALETMVNNVGAFYAEASHNQLSLNFTFLYDTGGVPFTAASDINQYGDPEMGDVLIRDAITKAANLHGIQHMNSSLPNYYDAVIVLHAGYGNESTDNAGDIWSAFYSFPATSGFSEGIVMPEFEAGGLSPFGVFCHEMGHQIGLPDLYATDGRAAPSQVGDWCLMDMGAWAGNGANPSHPNAWCKQLLSWITPSVITQDKATVTISSSSAVRINIPTADDPSREYFLVEYRSRSSGAYDRNLPASGTLIWHVDESVIDGEVTWNNYSDTRLNHNIVNNSYLTNHRGVDLAEADDTDPSINSGDSGDPWPSAQNTVFTQPRSNAFNGTVSGISLSNFATAGGNVSFAVTQIAAAETMAINRIINYPNPAGPSYIHPEQTSGILTTLVVQMAKPPQDMDITIYNMAGERVRFITRDLIEFNVDRSDDLRWVYTFDWNGKNDSSENVASGVYLYRVRADKEYKMGKLAIIR